MPESEKLMARLVDHYLLYSWFSSLKVDESILSTILQSILYQKYSIYIILYFLNIKNKIRL